MISSCLGMAWIINHKGIPDYIPKDLREAKRMIKKECIGRTSTSSLLGLHFRLDNLSEEHQKKFEVFVKTICDNTIKKYNKVKKK